MAMPKKGSRNIIVENVPYRWRFGGGRQAVRLGASNLSVSIEPVSDNGNITLLFVDTSVAWDECELTGLNRHKASITPGVVATYIRLGLKQGWNPKNKGMPFILIADESIAVEKGRRIEN